MEIRHGQENVTAMDTLKAATDLTDAGMNEDHAKAIARVVNDYGRDDLATKTDIGVLRTDIGVLRTDMDTGFASMRTEFDLKLSATESRIKFELYKVGSMIVGALAALGALLRLLS